MFFSGIVHAHSGLRWILLVLLIAATTNAFKKWKNKEKFDDLDNKLSLGLHLNSLSLIIFFHFHYA